MSISLFDVVGPIMIGPSSSHTAGAARLGNEAFRKLKHLPDKIEITLYNSFADTGEGHGTSKALLAGCLGISCHDPRLKQAEEIANGLNVSYLFHKRHNQKYHPNTAEICLSYKGNAIRLIGISLGGGRVAVHDVKSDISNDYTEENGSLKKINAEDIAHTFSEHLEECNNEPDKLISLAIERETAISGKDAREISDYMYQAWTVMKEGAEENILKKRKLFHGLCGGDAYKMKFNNNSGLLNQLSADAMAYAMAIGERNVGMGKIVAMPTAGSAGIFPGCLYSLYKNNGIEEEKIIKAMFIGGFIGLVAAQRATLAGSEAGCQAECGVAGAMASGAIAYLFGGSLQTISSAASIALSNSLGLVCDPISGLVAVPCIQRNGVFANLSFSAAAMALSGVEFVISLDEVIDTMFKVGQQLPCQLRETSRGGLAVTKTGIRYNKILLSREHI